MSLPPLPASLRSELLELRYRKHRIATNLLIVEGRSQIRELAGTNWTLRYAVTSGSTRPPEVPKDLALYQAEPALIGRISELQHPPDLLICAEHASATFADLDPSKPVIFTDAIADPGNLGTMLRTGEWFGITQWLLGPGTVDPYNAKVIRAAMGSLPRVRVVAAVSPIDELKQLRKRGMRIVATVPDAPSELALTSTDCILFGSEAHGLSPEYLDLANERYSIARRGPTESLNVAIAFAIIAHKVKL